MKFFIKREYLVSLAFLTAYSSFPSVLWADTNPVFVSYTSSSNAVNSNVLVTVPAPGSGWSYSAAAQIAGTKWNQISAPNNPIPDGTGSGNINTTNTLSTANNLTLTNPAGVATGINLTEQIIVGATLDTSSTRYDPRSGSFAASNSLAPYPLMCTGWRIYTSGVHLRHNLSNLSTNAPYLLYIYSSIAAANSWGSSNVLSSSNVFSSNPSYLDIPGSPTGYLFTNAAGTVSPIAPAPAGQSNTVAVQPSGAPTWGVLLAQSDANGKLSFDTMKATLGANNGYINGWQLIPYPLPVITTQPVTTTNIAAGSNAVLSVMVTNWYTNSFSYQWQKGGVNLSDGTTGNSTSMYSGTTSPVLTISNLATGDAGSFNVVVSNAGGSVTSSVSTLIVTGGSFITLNHSLSNSVTFWYQGTPYRDPGAVVVDSTDGTIPEIGSGSVNTSALGSYTITYPAYTDSLGVITPGISRTVIVVAAPSLALNGSNPLSVNWGSAFSDPGATLNDPMDGTVTVSASNSPDTTKLGSTTLTYAFTNSVGNVVTPIQRIVNVVPVTPNLPTIGSNSYDITVPNSAINGGAVASTNNASSVNASAINAYISYCSTNGGGTVLIPAGTFVSDTITLRSNVNLQLASNAVLKNSNYNNTLVTTTGSPSDVAITGSGAIDGGATTTVGANNLIVLTSCTRLLIQGVTIKNSGHEHLVIQNGNHVTVDGVTVTDVNTLAANGGAYLANTDGIDYYGQNFLFKNCKVDDGDDDIVAKPLGSACVNITITNCTVTAGHGIGVGGGTQLGLTNYLVTDCGFTGTDYGVRIKAGDNPTNNPGGTVSNVVYRNIAMTNVARPLVLESWYDSGDNFPSSPTDYSVYTTKYSSNNTFYTTNARATDAYTPMFQNVSYLNITITNCMYPGDFEGMYTIPRNINGLTFSNVTISVASNASTSSQFNLWHATNVTISNLKVTTSTRNAYYNASPLKGVWTNDLGGLTLLTNTVTPATVTISNTNQTYDGTAKAVTAIVSPTAAAPLSVTYSNLSYAVSATPPTNAGSYTVVGSVTNTGYTGSSTATLIISPATALINFSNTNQPYNGFARSVIVSTTPGNLRTTLTYGGSSNAPIGVGSYALQSAVVDSNYSGSASSTLVIYDAVASWRQSLFGTGSNTGNAADTATPYGIGLNNLQAYTLGIDPTHPLNKPLLSISNAGSNTVTLSFLARSAGSGAGYAALTRFYNLESTTNLTNSSWSPVSGYSNIQASNQTIILSTNASGASKLFYRLKAWLQ